MLRVGRILICVYTTNKDCLLLLLLHSHFRFYWPRYTKMSHVVSYVMSRSMRPCHIIAPATLPVLLLRLLISLRHPVPDFSRDASYSDFLHLTPSFPAAPWPWPQPFLSPSSVVPGKSRTDPKRVHTHTNPKNTMCGHGCRHGSAKGGNSHTMYACNSDIETTGRGRGKGRREESQRAR
jgi:hypothetical protein